MPLLFWLAGIRFVHKTTVLCISGMATGRTVAILVHRLKHLYRTRLRNISLQPHKCRSGITVLICNRANGPHQRQVVDVRTQFGKVILYSYCETILTTITFYDTELCSLDSVSISGTPRIVPVPRRRKADL